MGEFLLEIENNSLTTHQRRTLVLEGVDLSLFTAAAVDVMPDRSDSFDPYEEWLEIPPEEQPPSYYRLLGIAEFEKDLSVIDAAAKKRTAYLHPMGSGPEREAIHRLLGEVAKARRTLLNEESKRDYDHALQKSLHGNATNSEGSTEPQNDSGNLGNVVERVDTTHSFRIDTGDDARGQSESSARGAKRQSVPRSQTRSGSQRGQESSPKRKKQWFNDWRVHAASILTLLTLVIGFVIYTNSRQNRRAAAPMSTNPSPSKPSNDPTSANSIPTRNATQSSGRAPTTDTNRRARQRAAAARRANSNSANESATRHSASGLNAAGKGKSQLAIALEAQMAKTSGADDSADPNRKKASEGSANAEKANAKQDPANPGKGRKGKPPISVKLDLANEWLASLKSIGKEGQLSQEAFDELKGAAKIKFQDGRLELLPVADGSRNGSLLASGVKVKLGESASVETNLRKGLPEGSRVGLIVGPIRVRLESKKNNLEVRMHSQKLGAFAAKANGVVRLAVIRDPENSKAFRWVVQAAGKALTGRAELEQEVAGELSVGLLFAGQKKAIAKPVWMRNLSAGKLVNPPSFKTSKLVLIPAQE